MTIYYPTTSDFVQKTLNAELLSGVTAAATLNNVTAIQNKAGIMIIDRIDANGVETPNKVEVISFAGTSGSTTTTLVRGLAGTTDQDHAVGAIVEFGPDIVWAQGVIDALLNLVDQTGAVDLTKVVTPSGTQTLFNKMASGPSLSSPQILNPTFSGSGFGTLASLSLITSALGNPKVILGSDATGDIYYRSATGILARLGIGTEGQFLKANASLPIWDTFAVSTKTRSIWIPASAMQKDGLTGSGTVARSSVDDIGHFFLLDRDTQEGASFNVVLPADFSSGNLSYYIYYTKSADGVGNVRWRIRNGGLADEGEQADLAAANNDFTDTPVSNTAGILSIATVLTLATTNSSPGAIQSIGVFRMGADAADTYGGDIRLLGVRIDYTSIQ